MSPRLWFLSFISAAAAGAHSPASHSPEQELVLAVHPKSTNGVSWPGFGHAPVPVAVADGVWLGWACAMCPPFCPGLGVVRCWVAPLHGMQKQLLRRINKGVLKPNESSAYSRQMVSSTHQAPFLGKGCFLLCPHYPLHSWLCMGWDATESTW